MSNLHSAVYEDPKGLSSKLDLRWSREISKRLGVKRKDTLGAKFYLSRKGDPRVAIRANPDPKKGFRPLKLYQSGTQCDRIRLGIGSVLDYCPSSPSVYKFAGKTMYVEVPFVVNGDGGTDE